MDSVIASHTADVRTELARAEGKAATLLQLAFGELGLLAGVATIARPPAAAIFVGAAAAALTAVAVWLLTAVLQPWLGDRCGGWLGYAGLTANQVRDRADEVADHAEQLGVLAALAVRRFQLVRTAVWLLRGTVPLVLVAAGIAAIAS